MKKTKYFLLILLLALISSCNLMQKEADLIIINANVYTVDENFSQATWIAVKEGIIVATGDDEQANPYTSTVIMDVQGAFVYPGFYDAHCHFLSYGIGKLKRADLRGAGSFEEVLDRVTRHADSNPSEWIEGRGWDQNDWEVKEFPCREALDNIFPDRPVILTRIDGHAALVNGEALRRAGIDAETQLTGGDVILADGVPTGVLIDMAIELVSAVIPEDNPELIRAGLLAGQEDCFAAGLTSVMDAGLEVANIRIIDSLHQEGKLKLDRKLP